MTKADELWEKYSGEDDYGTKVMLYSDFIAALQEYSDIVSDGGLDPRTKYEAERFKRQWVGLTDEEIKDIVGRNDPGGIGRYTRDLFKKIEAKLKEKNG